MTDKRIDTYLAKSESFAKPILVHLRKLIHQAVPEVEETIKWGFPHFVYKENILCSMASFKKHCAFIFWNGKFLNDSDKILEKDNRTAMGHLGKITSLDDLPSDKQLVAYIKKAAVFDNASRPKQIKKAEASKELKVPDVLLKALTKNKKAKEVFENFSYTNKKDYADWITEAKTDETRQKRLATAIEWMNEGKDRNWKYRK